MDPITWILGGITVAAISSVVTNTVGSKNKVSDKICGERRESCSTLIHQDIQYVKDTVERIEKKVDGLNNAKDRK